MKRHIRSRRSIAARAAVFALLLASMSPVVASVISTSPTLPVLGVPYAASSSVGCFPAAGVCVESGTITPTSLVTSSFNFSGQDLITDMLFTGILTDLSNAPLGTVTLVGTMEQEVLGRTFPTQTGSWSIELLGLNLSGPVLGHTLTLGLDPSMTSTGGASIDPLAAAEPLFRIDSFFDVFVELSLDFPTPLHALRGPVHLAMVTVPEPASYALLMAGLGLLAFVARRRKQQVA